MPDVGRRGARQVYCEALFDRGAGLGTRLFPWGRCVCFSQATDTPMLAPRWVQPRIGPLLRGGLSLTAYPRQILLMGLFRSTGYVSGLERWRVTSSATRAVEDGFGDVLASHAGEAPVIVTFRGYRSLFQDFAGERELLLSRLRADARGRWVRLAERLAEPIGINVRCANDFSAAHRASDFITRGAVKTPLDWFVKTLKRLREMAGKSVPAVVVSDGTPRQLRDLLMLPDVRLARPGCAISDLLTLARSRVLLGSGGSSFSAWASFLANAPTLTHPGQSLVWFKLESSDARYIGDFDPSADADPELSYQLRAALGDVPTSAAPALRQYAPSGAALT